MYAQCVALIAPNERAGSVTIDGERRTKVPIFIPGQQFHSYQECVMLSYLSRATLIRVSNCTLEPG